MVEGIALLILISQIGFFGWLKKKKPNTSLIVVLASYFVMWVFYFIWITL